MSSLPINRDLIYEYFFHLKYPSISKFCLINKYVYNICSKDSYVRKLIRRKKIEHKTDLLINNADISDKITEASKLGNAEIVDELIKRGYDPSENNNKAIREASAKGHLGVVNCLLKDERVNPSANKNESIQLASGHVRREPYGDI